MLLVLQFPQQIFKFNGNKNIYFFKKVRIFKIHNRRKSFADCYRNLGKKNSSKEYNFFFCILNLMFRRAEVSYPVPFQNYNNGFPNLLARELKAEFPDFEFQIQ